MSLLKELNESNAKTTVRHAFFRGARGPNDLSGVELAYVQSRHDFNHTVASEADAESEAHELDGRDVHARRERRRAEELRARDHKGFYFPDLGWWMSQKEYDAEKDGFGGVNKKQIEKDHPEMKIHKNKEDAVHSAEQEGR